MSRLGQWVFSPGEKLAVGVSLADGLDSGVTLTGTPSVTVWSKSGTTYTELTAGTDYTVGSVTVNAATFQDQNRDTVAIGTGVTWFLTAPETLGRYYVLISCAATDGSDPDTWYSLVVEGPGPS